MKSIYWWILVPLLLAGCGILVGNASEREPQQKTVAAGEAFAVYACSACHQVGPEQSPPRPVFNADENEWVRAPSFEKIGRDPTKDAEYLRSIITLPHYPMKEQLILDERLDAVVAYILSFREPNDF